MSETKHAMLSPSGAHRWMVCVGAPAMEMGLPDSSNEYSDEGTCAHKVAAMCFAEKRPASAYIGRFIEVGPCRTYEFRDDMAEPTQCYVDFVNALPGEKHHEVEVPIGHLTGEEDAYGTADTVAIPEDEEEIIVVDLKFGMGVFVNAERNKQGMTYALGVLKKYNVLGTFKRVRILIHQPRISETPSEWDCSVEDLLAFGAEVEEAAKLAMHAVKFRANWINTKPPFEFLKAGEEQCKFCKAKAACPEAARYVQEAVGADFEVIVKAETHADCAAVIAATAPAVQTPERLALKLTATGLIEDWIKAVRAEAERRLLAGDTVPGYKIVQGRQGNRAWSDPVAAEALLKTFRLKQEEMYSFKLISPTKAAEIGPKLDKKTGDIKKDQPDNLVIGVRQWPKLALLITRSPGAKSVAPENDPRPALEMNPLADHEVVDPNSVDDLV